MPHQRERYLEKNLERFRNAAPVLGVLGQRQTGKSTLVSRLCKTYVTMDDRVSFEAATSDPGSFLEGRKEPLAIDECQLVPQLFPAIKESVRKKPGRGRFILTGSVRFTSRKAIRESLTGRILNLELLPMTLSETLSLSLSSLVPDFLRSKAPTAKSLTQKQFDHYLKSGGLPGICFLRDEFVRGRLFETHLETLLDRDLRLVLQTTLGFTTLRGVLETLALLQGQPLDAAELSRRTGVSVVTLRRLIPALEAIFLIRVVPTEGGNRKPVVFMEDQGQATHLAENRYTSHQQLTRGLFASVRGQLHYRPELNARVFQYRTRGGAVVPLAWHTRDATIGVIPVLEKKPGKAAIASAQSFCKAYPRSKVLIAHAGAETELISSSIALLPALSLAR